MNRIATLLASPLVLLLTACTQGRNASTDAVDAAGSSAPAEGVTHAGSPYLGMLEDSFIYGDLWERPQISKRDRSMVTIAALQALYRDEVRLQISRGLDNGLTPEEISEIILHASFYAGFPTGVKASRFAAEVFQERGLSVNPSVLDGDPPGLPPVDYTAGGYAAIPRLGELRNSLLFGDIWERPQLSQRDRSMLTVAVNQATRATSELRAHLQRALDQYGVTQQELQEVLLQVTFLAGWPAGVSAGGEAAEVFEERGLPLGTARE